MQSMLSKPDDADITQYHQYRHGGGGEGMSRSGASTPVSATHTSPLAATAHNKVHIANMWAFVLRKMGVRC